MSEENNKAEPSNRRRGPRTSVMFMASMSRGGVSMPVRLVSLSTHGAAIASAELPLPNARVELHRPGLSVRGRLVWLRGGLGGLQFEQDLDPASILRPVAKSQRVQPARCRREPLRPGRMTKAEEASIERCRNLLGIGITLIQSA